MKATGIVRRIDDLGRIVIPKDIRRSLGIREGDPLEIYTDREGCVIFKKYAPLGSIVDHAENAYKTLKKRKIILPIDSTQLSDFCSIFQTFFKYSSHYFE